MCTCLTDPNEHHTPAFDASGQGLGPAPHFRAETSCHVGMIFD